ncbi:recombinase family protein [Streptomyces sp. NPDC056661]|uniref:recombinase family protein n=1 Tax=Streptomyces sp. NPDC056661 TaxID=3345898 RepID=UPI0036879651
MRTPPLARDSHRRPDRGRPALDRGQKLDRQVDALTAAGCRRIFADKKSSKNNLRAELMACHAFLTPGDTLVAPLDRYGRSLQDLVNMVAELRERGIGFRSLHEALDTTAPGGRLTIHVFAALAEFIRALIVADTHDWPPPAPAAVREGAPPSSTRTSSARPATCCPTRPTASPPSPRSAASPSARFLTKSRS